VRLEHKILQEIGCYGRYRLGNFGEDQISDVLQLSELGLISILHDPFDGEFEDDTAQWCELTTDGRLRLYELNESYIDLSSDHLSLGWNEESEETPSHQE
jgi:hypothetical protein